MPDEPREIRIKRPASHIHCSRCLSFIPRHRVRRKQAFTELGRTRWNCNTCCSDGSGGAGALAREVSDVRVGGSRPRLSGRARLLPRVAACMCGASSDFRISQKMFHVEHYENSVGRSNGATRSLKLQGHELRRLLAYIRQRVGVPAGQPLHIAGLKVSRHRALAFDVAAHFEIADRDQQVRAGMMMAGQDCPRLQLDFGNPHAIFYEPDVLGSAIDHVQPAFFVPLGWRRLARLYVLKELDSHIAKGLVGKILRDVGESAGREPRLTILQLERERRLALYFVRDFGRAKGHRKHSRGDAGA